MTITERPPQTKLQYQTGFANEFATEAIANTLPQGQNSPQRVAHGLYAEQLSGTPFTVARHLNRRSWLYRIRPSVKHEPFRKLRNGDALAEGTPNQLRWDPFAIPSKATDFVDGVITICGNGDPSMTTGIRSCRSASASFGVVVMIVNVRRTVSVARPKLSPTVEVYRRSIPRPASRPAK